MNVILNPSEVATVVSLVTAQLLDSVELTDKGQAAIRDWRADRVPGRDEVESFADTFNDTLMEFIESSTHRRYVKAGRVIRGTAEERARA